MTHPNAWRGNGRRYPADEPLIFNRSARWWIAEAITLFVLLAFVVAVVEMSERLT